MKPSRLSIYPATSPRIPPIAMGIYICVFVLIHTYIYIYICFSGWLSVWVYVCVSECFCSCSIDNRNHAPHLFPYRHIFLTLLIYPNNRPNSFKLHRLPVPRPGEVLGLVGTNGIGKSTALKILANKQTPNLGRFDKPPGWSEILQYFRGSELQNYFTKMLEDKLKAVIKPQVNKEGRKKKRERKREEEREINK